MKKSELLKFIEDEVNQVVKSEKSKPVPKKQAPEKPKELKEEDFDEVMFKKVNESKEKKSNNKSNMEKKLNLDELKKLIKEAIETNEVKAKPEGDKISFDKEKLPNLHQTLSLLKKYYVLYPNLDLETRKLTHTAKGEQLSKLLDKIQNLTRKALDIAEPIKTKTKKEK